ncbi:hypothetical protein VSH64_09630 [Amycolatopsis rhabdoformis]|uniref:Uncharacterized protein n=1 Tax=Amycolatopsis rhabdoformis TaxID=1448059 RepID=A0ABZ1IDL4_9PSEU|nr:hypothetical protein [Amycolatopsis rhabdoformis]WSE32362.1 hypothetical protein VSH64_09630 [Amycolatopsis rhabdoformis]
MTGPQTVVDEFKLPQPRFADRGSTADATGRAGTARGAGRAGSTDLALVGVRHGSIRPRQRDAAGR